MDRLRASPVTFVLAAINVAYFLWVERHGSSTDLATLVRFGAVEQMHVRAGDYWRLASYMILHIGWGHLLLNTWAGMSWCAVVERAMGPWRFLLVYVLAGLGGGASCALFSPNAVTAGASGAMFGVIGSLLAIRYRTLGSFAAFAADRGVRATLGQIAIWTLLGVYAIRMSQSAHFGGFFTGALVTLVMMVRARRALAWAAFTLAFLAFTAAATRPWELGRARGTSVDFAQVKIDRLGRPTENAAIVLLAARPACESGIERACVVDAIARLDPDDHPLCVRTYEVFERACTRGDADACAGQGMQLGMGCGVPEDLDRGRALLERACESGSAYACALKL
ncbi:MAG: rhomboid family intramembrane serine protease [Labilithrix sp.]|nr:rhomboid family intramembrane serine protease [Labilithrix sp.]MCW5816233.1 rhomboid family intramembrane serine protease [Labilithrix sp.]